jgi:hypothetical protein
VVLMTIIAIVEEAFFEAQNHKSDDENKERAEIHGASTTESDRKSEHSSSPLSVPSVLLPPHDSELMVSTPTSGKVGRTTADTWTNNNNNSSSNINNSSSSSSNSLMDRSGHMGKRDLPDKLRFLLKNVDRNHAPTVTTANNSDKQPVAASPQQP